MKKWVLMVSVILVILAAPAVRASDRTAAASQLAISADHVFWKVGENLSGYGSGNFVLTLNNGYSYLQGYVGGRVTTDRISLALLGATRNDAYGWSVGLSLLARYSDEHNDFVTQFDHYVPYMSTVNKEDPALMGTDPPLPPHSYFFYSEYMYKIKDSTGVGVALESFGKYEDNDPSELSYGPFFQMNRLRLWAYYDVTPQVDGFEVLGLRFQIKL